MRRLLLAAAGCLVVMGMVVPSAAAVTPPVNPKVVIIVGPVAGSTNYYKSDADAAAAEALKYTTNVIKIYTPHATWARAKAALQGASIVIYMGHGNGWPSPYGPFQPYTKDGLGLNPYDTTTNNTTTKYWGEYYLARDVRLAPNAVVLLHHLCYSAGNSEPGRADPTRTVAKKRIDNFGAGFLRTGADVVFAEPRGNPAYILDDLFHSSKTMKQIFWDSPESKHTYSFMFTSSRTRGAVAISDPYRPGKYYRSLVGFIGLRATTWRS